MYYAVLIGIGLIFLWRIVTGFKRGMVKEIISLIAMAVAGVCVLLILAAIGNYMEREIGELIQMVVVLFVVCLIYRIVHVLLGSLKLIAKLPIIKWLDKILGAVVGFIEAGLITGLLVYFLKNWGLSML